MGDNWAHRQSQTATDAGRSGLSYSPLKRHLSVHGVGSGSQTAQHSAHVPVHIAGSDGQFHGPVLRDGTGKNMPGLWGLRSQREKKTIIDTGGNTVIIPGPGGFKMHLSPGSVVIKCESAVSGHMMVPTSDWHSKVSTPKDGKKWIFYGTEGERGSAPASDDGAAVSSSRPALEPRNLEAPITRE